MKHDINTYVIFACDTISGDHNVFQARNLKEAILFYLIESRVRHAWPNDFEMWEMVSGQSTLVDLSSLQEAIDYTKKTFLAGMEDDDDPREYDNLIEDDFMQQVTIMEITPEGRVASYGDFRQNAYTVAEREDWYPEIQDKATGLLQRYEGRKIFESILNHSEVPDESETN